MSKGGRISAQEALAAIDKVRREYKADPRLTWPTWPESPPFPGVCPNDTCLHEPRQGVVIPTKLRVGEDGRAVCGMCGYVDERRIYRVI